MGGEEGVAFLVAPELRAAHVLDLGELGGLLQVCQAGAFSFAAAGGGFEQPSCGTA